VIRTLATLALLAAALALHLFGLAPFIERGGQDFDAIHVYLPFAKRLLHEGPAFLLTEDSVQAPPFAYAWPALLGGDLAAVKLANVALSCGLLLLVYRTATLWHSRLAGFAAAFAFALSPLMKPYLPTALTEPPFLFLIGAWIWGLSEWRVRDRPVHVYVAGVALGLALLTRASFFYGLLLLLPFLWRSRPAFAAHAIALAFPLAFIAKNLLVFGFPFYVTGAGNALYLGTSPLFRGYDPAYLGLVYDVGAVTGLPTHLTIAADAKLAAAARLLLSSASLPDLAAMYAQKLAAFVFVTNAETSGDVFVLRSWRVATLVLAIIGLAGLRDRFLRWLLVGILAYQVAAHTPLLYNHRYSVGALDVWLTLLAGVGIARLWQRRRAREIAATGAALAIGIAAADNHAKNGGMPEPDVFAAPHVLLWESSAPVAEIDVTTAPQFSDWFNHVLVIDAKPCGPLRLDYPDGRSWTVPMKDDALRQTHQVGMLAPRARISMDCAGGRAWSIHRMAVYSARGALALRNQLESGAVKKP
jgi:hypothetical protein